MRHMTSLMEVLRTAKRKHVLYFFGVLVGALVSLEIAVRLFGLTSYPVYIRSQAVGYFLAPNQRGAFLNKNHWFVDDQGFANEKPFVVSHPNTILVGDSVVFGGNPVDYDLRIGTIAAKITRRDIWSASAGGWSLLNELAFLKLHKTQVYQADKLIFVVNRGDFGCAAQWAGELALPTRRPVLATVYFLKRYVLPHSEELPPITVKSDSLCEREWQDGLDDLLTHYSGQVSFILYPDKHDLNDHNAWRMEMVAIRRYIAAHSRRIMLFDLSTVPGWNLSRYRDGTHPNPAGNRILAAVVAKLVKIDSASKL